MFYFFLLFTAVPLIELWLLVQLSSAIGFGETIALVLGTGLAGAALARWQGWQVMRRLQSEMQQGMLPAQALGDGVLILVAGVLLITPGVLTDIVGLGLLIPPIRLVLKKGIQRWLTRRVHVQSTGNWQSTNHGSEARPRGDEIIDVQVIETHVVGDQDE